MMPLPWNERVVMLQINPDAASISDIMRLAEEHARLRKFVGQVLSGRYAISEVYRLAIDLVDKLDKGE